MKRMSVLLLLASLLGSTLLLAQEDKQEEELLPPRRSAGAKLGGAGGFTPQLLFINIDPINEVLRSANAAEFENGRILLLGGQGYGYVMFIENLRIGGMGVSGSVISKSLVGNTRREVDLSVGVAGVTFDYVLPVVKRLDLSIGMLLGGGSLDMKISRDDGFAKRWDNIWTEFGSSQPAQEYSRKLTGSFFVFQPSVNFEFSILRWLGVRAGLSYVGMAGGDWKLDDTYDVYGAPDAISGKGWMINSGIFLGTFVY